MRVVNGLFYSGGGESTTGLASDLLAGKKLNNEDGDSVIGTMPNNGAVGGTITQQTGKVIIPAGYTSGGQVEVNISGLMAGNIKSGANVGGVVGNFTTDANAVATDILTTKTAYVNGAKITGSMANHGAITQTISTQGGQYTVPAGYHNGSGKVTASFANLVAANVRNGVNIGGVVGAVIPSQYSSGTFQWNIPSPFKNCFRFPALDVGFNPTIVEYSFHFPQSSNRTLYYLYSANLPWRTESNYKLMNYNIDNARYLAPQPTYSDNGTTSLSSTTTFLTATGVREFYLYSLNQGTNPSTYVNWQAWTF